MVIILMIYIDRRKQINKGTVFLIFFQKKTGANSTCFLKQFNLF